MPEWMKQNDSYVPPRDGGMFAVKTLRSLSRSMSRLRIQQGHEKKHALPAMSKLVLLAAAILTLSLSRNGLMLLAFLAVLQAYLCTWPARDILAVLTTALAAALLSFVLFIPAMIWNPDGIANNLTLVLKIFLSVEMVTFFNHTTQWNHITAALKKLHIPGIFIFTVDIALKYIVLLGTLIEEILTALCLRAVGKHHKKYQSVGGVMGVTFLRGSQMSREMHEAMRCRGFTDDYKGL